MKIDLDRPRLKADLLYVYKILFKYVDVDSESFFCVIGTDNGTRLPDYTLYRLDRRDGRQGGGVAVYVKHGTACTYLSHLTHADSTGHTPCPERSHIY